MTKQLLSAAALFLLATNLCAADAKRYGAWGVDLDAMDRSVKPGDDFFRYVNGKWAASTQIPPDKTRIGSFDQLRDLSQERVRAILDRWAADRKLKAGSDEAKVAAMYRTFLDEATVEKLAGKPLASYLATVKKATTHDDIARVMAHSYETFGRSFFNANVDDDAKNPDNNALYLLQSGLGL
ncbi:MAG TPA: peptidase M13, partial [Thermoanaerobaculia bacterium]|nr:peptidase M13 [Thermoanaerobaculia bacterium]